MMTFNQFVSKWIGKKADFDGAYGGQCVDLFRFYCKEVLNIPQPKSVVGAKDFWTNYSTDKVLYNNFDKIYNSPKFTPIKGDVMIWNANAGNGFGHIAMCTGENTGTQYFKSFDQNWTRVSYCEIVNHSYKNVFGVLRPKVIENPVPIPPEEEDMLLEYLGIENEEEAKAKLKEHLGELDGKCDWGNSDSDRGGFLGSARRQNTELEKEVLELENTIRELNQEIEDHVCPTVPDDTEWVANGRTEKFIDGQKEVTINYERKA